MTFSSTDAAHFLYQRLQRLALDEGDVAAAFELAVIARRRSDETTERAAQRVIDGERSHSARFEAYMQSLHRIGIPQWRRALVTWLMVHHDLSRPQAQTVVMQRRPPPRKFTCPWPEQLLACTQDSNGDKPC